MCNNISIQACSGVFHRMASCIESHMRCLHSCYDVKHKFNASHACCSMLQCVAMCHWGQCVAVCCSASFNACILDMTSCTNSMPRMCVAVCCSVLQCVAMCHWDECVAGCCSALRCVAACHSMPAFLIMTSCTNSMHRMCMQVLIMYITVFEIFNNV